MLQTFLPQFLMTFFICLFIVMMQFLWRYIDDLVGKGLSIDVVAELFFYAALSMIPMALPLAILLASLMTFGNLGEHVELTALKSSGISLIKVMKPLIFFIAAIAVGAFFFQNNVLPRSQVKMWTLLFSMRQKSPTLDIPEGTVYRQIPGYNLFVKHKNEETGALYNLLIYDVSSNGTSYPRIVAADSGRLAMTDDLKHLVLNLYSGNWYEEMRSGSSGVTKGALYRREAFHDKEIMIPYDANFTRMDDQAMRSQYVGKNINELQHTIDSVQLRVDSVGDAIAREMKRRPVVGVPVWHQVQHGNTYVNERVPVVKPARVPDFDSIMKALSPTQRQIVLDRATMHTTNVRQDYEFKGYTVTDDNYTIRRHKIELIKKFTLSLACLIFFFIGAPLGAIIRKGGLGTPIVVSVLLFIVYYIIDNMGYKLARDDHWPVWQGIWLSSAVLLPLGIFLTYKAVNDSAVFNPDAYANFFRRIAGVHQTRHLAIKEVVINDVETGEAIARLDALKQSCNQFLERYKNRQGYLEYLQYGYDKPTLRALGQQIDDTVEYLSNSRDQMVINKAMDFPIIRQLLTYHVTNYPRVGTALAVLFPIGLPLYLVGIHHQRNLKREVQQAALVCDQAKAIFTGQYTREMEYNS